MMKLGTKDSSSLVPSARNIVIQSTSNKKFLLFHYDSLPMIHGPWIMKATKMKFQTRCWYENIIQLIWNNSCLSMQLFAIINFLESSMHFPVQPLVICCCCQIFFLHLYTNNNQVSEFPWLRNSIELNLKVWEFLWTVLNNREWS